MKFKLIQFGILLVIVMSIVYMAQTQNGFGHSIGGTHTNMSHPSEFYVDKDGNSKGANNSFRDPRTDSYYKDSNGNGTESASSWALRYFASPLYNGSGGVACPADQANADEINRRRTQYSQMVIGARLALSASAGNSSCSGSITPSLTKDLGLVASHFPGWSGWGMVHLHIKENNNAKKLIPVWLTTRVRIIITVDAELEESYHNKLKVYKNFHILVSDTQLTEKEDKELGGQVGHGPANFTAKWTGSVGRSTSGVYSYPFGFDFTLDPGFWAGYFQTDYQQDKYAEIDANIGEEIKPDSINASFTGRQISDGRY